MENIGKRLKEIRESNRLKQIEMAKILGIAQNTLSSWENNLTAPPADKLSIYISKFGISSDWIITGEGTANYEDRQRELGEDFLKVPLFDGRVAAGPDGAVLFEEKTSEFPFKKEWITRLVGTSAERQRALILTRVTGDSMHPTISSGELVLVDTWLAERLTVKPNRIYLIRLQDMESISIKRIQLHIRDHEVALVCRSDNPRMREFNIQVLKGMKFQSHVLGRVRWVGKEFD